MTIIRLIYLSTATRSYSMEELQDMTDAFADPNVSDQITGCLRFARGSFLQVLEGDKSKVIALYGRIERDPRHRECELISKIEVDTRAFQNWSMRLVPAEHPFADSFPVDVQEAVQAFRNLQVSDQSVLLRPF